MMKSGICNRLFLAGIGLGITGNVELAGISNKKGQPMLANPLKSLWCRRRDLNPHGRNPLPPQDSVSTRFHHFGTVASHRAHRASEFLNDFNLHLQLLAQLGFLLSAQVLPLPLQPLQPQVEPEPPQALPLPRQGPLAHSVLPALLPEQRSRT